MIEDLSTFVQTAVVESLGPAGRERIARIERFRPPLRALRDSYRRGAAPDFSDASLRGAYAMAYYPHHAALAAAAFNAAGPHLLGLEPDATVVVLGAGPGPEVVGLAHALEGAGHEGPINVHLVDREPGWRRTRETTLTAVLPQLWSGELVLEELEADLSTGDGLATIGPLLRRAALIVVETLLTELPDPGGDGALADRLAQLLPPDGRLMTIDLDRVRRYAASRVRLGEDGHLTTRLRSSLSFPAGRPVPELADHLFAKENGLWPRSELHCEVRLLSRPGLLRPTRSSTEFVPTPSQAAALEVLDDFLAGDGRVLVLQGAAGTGKTALFPDIIQRAEAAGLPVTLLAPTGQAARRLERTAGRGGSTVHSLIYRFNSREGSDEEDLPPTTVFGAARVPDDAALYLVDEASLIGDRALPDEHPEVLFGEGRLLSDLIAYALAHPTSKMVLVGDPDQLPPVGEVEPVALLAKRLEPITGESPTIVTLHEIVRQRDAALADLAHGARLATRDTGLLIDPKAAQNGITQLSSRQLPEWLEAATLDGAAVVVTYRNADVSSWNRIVRLGGGRPAERPVSGDRVTVLRRDFATGLLNGDDLVVADASDAVRKVKIRDEEVHLRPVTVRKDVAGVGHVVFDALIVDELLADATSGAHALVTRVLFRDFVRRTGLRQGDPEFDNVYSHDPAAQALRVGYSYARTCHRAQGGEWDNVVIDFAGTRRMPDFGCWAYTALTRAKRALWLVKAPRGSGPVGVDGLLVGAADAVADLGYSVTRIKPLDRGVKIAVRCGAEELQVDFYEKEGAPSRAVRSGSQRPAFTNEVIERLEAWGEQVRRESQDPLPDRLTDLARELGALAVARGYDLDVYPHAQYEVCFELKARGRRAVRRYSHNGLGVLTSEQSVDGDLELLADLATLLEGIAP